MAMAQLEGEGLGLAKLGVLLKNILNIKLLFTHRVSSSFFAVCMAFGKTRTLFTSTLPRFFGSCHVPLGRVPCAWFSLKGFFFLSFFHQRGGTQTTMRS